MATLSTTKPLQVFCLYASQGGSTKKLAEAAQERLSALFAHDETFSCEVEDLATFNPDILVTQSDDLVYAGDDSNKNSLQSLEKKISTFLVSFRSNSIFSCSDSKKKIQTDKLLLCSLFHLITAKPPNLVYHSRNGWKILHLISEFQEMQ